MVSKAISKLLIANRGEIAVRIIATARKMGVATVAVYSDADRRALHVSQADEAIHIGGSAAAESYLRGDKIIAVGLEMHCDAIHPGYGFLSENAQFATDCNAAGLIFIGPSARAIEAMADKANAKALMQKASVPVVPGYDGKDQSIAAFTRAADKITYPILLKAIAGGGGRGMRQVWNAEEFPEAFQSARREAETAFGNGDLIIEKLIADARHIEFQIFADAHGNCIHLGERDCSFQRRHQKIIEEAPSPFLSDALRQTMGDAAVAAAKSVNYCGAGTVEFIVDDAGKFFFLEMNTRLQVEHPVTEMIAGLDLVEWQLRVGAGEKLPLLQSQVQFNGHAIEARLYTEDTANNFAPQTGKILHWKPQADPTRGLRIDAGIVAGDEISPWYDPMVAKFIAHGDTRNEARAKLDQLLSDAPLLGVRNNGVFLRKLIATPEFTKGQVTTGLIDRWISEKADIVTPKECPIEVWSMAAALFTYTPGGDWFRSTGLARYPLTLSCGDEHRSRRSSANLIATNCRASHLDGDRFIQSPI